MKDSPRVLVASTSYPRFEDDPSGHFVRSEVAVAVRAGADVHVVAPDPVFDRGVAIHPLGGSALFAWPGAMARARSDPRRLGVVPSVMCAARRAIQRIGRIERAVVHFVVPMLFPILPRFRADEVEGVAHGADVRLLIAMPHALRAIAIDAILARSTSLRFVAARLLEMLTDGLDAKRTARIEARATVTPSPIDVPKKADVPRPETGIHPYVVWVGRDVPEKRLDLAIEAATSAGVRLVVVGARRSPPHPPGVAFVGEVGRAAALSWIAHAEALVSTSAVEGAPTAVREARTLDVPVVAVSAGDIAHWAVRDRGILVVEATASAIGRALTRP